MSLIPRLVMGYSASDSPPVAEDPYFADVSLLLHLDGEDGSTTFTDSSGTHKSITSSGSPQISTAQSQFGGASLSLNGTDQYLKGAMSSDFAFGTGDFTIEFWAYKGGDGVSGYDAVIDTSGNGSASGGWFVELSNSRGLVLARNSAVAIQYVTNPNNSTWAHYAIARKVTTIRAFINGTLVASASDSATYSANSTLRIGSISNGLYPFAGYLDDLRVTKGVARYTADFAIPESAFPDA